MFLPRQLTSLMLLLFSTVLLFGAEDAYRFENEFVRYESRENRGLTPEAIPKTKAFSFPRPRPALPFDMAPFAKIDGREGLPIKPVEITFREETGVARADARARFGFPLPKGAVFHKDAARLVDTAGAPMSAQFSITSRWPDSSIKWLLVDTAFPIEAQERKTVTLQFDQSIPKEKSELSFSENAEGIEVSTGAVTVQIDKVRYNLVRNAKLTAGGADRETWKNEAGGVMLTAADGSEFSTAGRAPDSVTIEESGPERLTVRVAGNYGNAKGEPFMGYVSRLVFRNGSPVVEIEHTHIDDDLSHEFTDISSLRMGFRAPGLITQVLSELPPPGEGRPRFLSGRELSVFQADEARSTWTIDGQVKAGGQTAGSWSVLADGAPLGIAILDFWQRWPKGFSAAGDAVSFDLLPKLPGEQYGDDLPYHLKFPFVSGKYRFKWGMSSTERLVVDLSGKVPRKQLQGEVQTPLIAIIPATWYAETRALGDIPAPRGEQFEIWDRFIERSFAEHRELSRAQREYGFFNYGDWFGERKRNWGNNEYDRAHCFFQQFARTGNTAYHRLALQAARHQADVDIVHAYPDPRYVGANHQHSIGHTGVWEGPNKPRQATWSHPYDEHTDGTNGHTWVDGMIDAWYLTGDASAGEASLALGEHLTWAVAPEFRSLGTHERSAGWSIKGLMGIYRFRPDPEYLKAAGQIAEVAIRSQTVTQGGAWAHKLPADHDSQQRLGNCPFLIGILLTALAEYHEQSGDEATWKALEAGAGWLRSAWNAERAAWPYSASETGESLFPGFPAHLSPLIANAIAYVAEKSERREDMDIVRKSLVRTFAFGDHEAVGKELAEVMNFTPDTFARMVRFYDKKAPEISATLLSESNDKLREEIMLAFPSGGEIWLRGPSEQNAALALTGEAGKAVIHRKPYGSAQDDAKESTFLARAADGTTLLEQKFSPREKLDIPLTLTGKAGEIFRLTMKDSILGAWRIVPENVRVVLDAGRKLHFAGLNQRRFFFFVPEGTQSFTITVSGVHQGEFGCAVISPDEKVVAYRHGSNPGPTALIGGGGKPRPPEPLVVSPEKSQSDRMWSLSLWAAGDLVCQITGVPPYLTSDRAGWFNPDKPPSQP